MIKYTKDCWKAWQSGEDFPKDDQKPFNKKVTFFEAITESLCQLGLSSFILKAFGISTSVSGKIAQFFSLIMSISSLTVSWISVRNIFDSFVEF